MPSNYTYPGVYVEEIPSGVRTIVGVSTSVTAFIGRTALGIVNEPKTITSFGDFERDFGGLDRNFPLSYAVRDFYLNGGSMAVIVRLVDTLSDDEKQAWAEKPIIEKLLADMTAAPDAAAAKAVVDNAVADVNNAKAKAKLEAVKAAVDAALAAQPPADKAAVVAICKTEADKYKDLKDNSAKASAENVSALALEAVSAGKWGNNLRAIFDTKFETEFDKNAYKALGIQEGKAFNLTVQMVNADNEVVATEIYRNLCADDVDHARYIGAVLKREGALVTVGKWEKLDSNPAKAVETAISEIKTAVDNAIDAAADKKAKDEAEKSIKTFADDAAKPVHQAIAKGINLSAVKDDASKDDVKSAVNAALNSGIPLTGGDDGEGLIATDYLGSEDKKEGLYALADADFNLLCIPPDSFNGDTPNEVYFKAAKYCMERRAMLIVDPSAAWGKSKSTAVKNAQDGFNSLVNGLGGIAARYAMLYFPRVIQRDPLKDGDMGTFAACGIIAGVMARTDATRGVWKAPAGIDAGMAGVPALQVALNDLENGQLNPLGINCLRNFPVIGNVVWGTRTLRGADILADDYKYVPIRRLANFIEESLYRGTKWVVFEPNDEPLWSQIRLNIGAFMQDLFRQGAFQGSTPRDAYLVKCDKETTTQFDIDRGIVNIVVGFAPLKPAEFVVLKIQQIRNQS